MIKKINFYFLLVIASITMSAAGCGGGGGGPLAPTAGTGSGRVSAAVHFTRLAAMARSAQYATGTVEIEISISGYYSENNTRFEPVEAEADIDIAVGYARISVLSVPIGINHLLVATAEYPDEATETVKCLIPEVAEGVTTEASADARTTVIAEAAVALAARNGKTLPQITAGEIEMIADTVDYFYSQGTYYSQMDVNSIIDFDANAEIVESVNIAPASAALYTGQTQQFSAEVLNIYGQEITAALSWSVEGNIGSIDSQGLFTAVEAGTGTVTVAAGGVSNGAAVAVTLSTCGNETVEGTEQCDDGNAVTETCVYGETSCTVCDSTCQEVAGATSYCGDETMDSVNSETCDSGSANGTACAADYGTSCNYCSASCRTVTVQGAYCGDSNIDSSDGETCDDGNAVTETCAYSQTSCAVCDSTCSSAAGATSYCGDSTVDTTNSEQCDDGNIADGDGCSATCQYEGPYCGDGNTDTEEGEQCDDGNADTEACPYGQNSCEVCDSTCRLVAGATSFCGDGTVDTGNGEQCDDENTAGGDGCSDTCRDEALLCGNGTLDDYEDCDDGEDNGTACFAPYNGACQYCDTDCTIAEAMGAFCGDNAINSGDGEECDDAGSNTETPCSAAYGQSCDYCDTLCVSHTVQGAYCGDNNIDTGDGETCDDGNAAGGDGCSATCQTEYIAPTVMGVSPSSGANNTTTNITITGTGFISGATVQVGTTSCTGVNVTDSTTLTATVPSGITASAYDVKVTNPDTQYGILESSFFVTGGGVTHSAHVTTSETWAAADSPHTVSGDIMVYNATLTIEAGAVVKFAAGARLTIGYTYYGYNGVLVADGSAGTILFTSSSTTPAQGDWDGIELTANTAAGTTLDSVIVEYAGNTLGAGVKFTGAAQTTIDNCEIRNNNGMGIIFADGTYPASFTGNTITGNSSYPVEIYGNFARYLSAGNYYTGNGTDAIKVMGDVVEVSGAWVNPGVPYEIQSNIAIYQSSAPPTLTIAAGATLQFMSGAALVIGNASYGYQGALVADGSGGAITFTSAGTMSPGAWKGIEFTGPTAGGTLLNNVVIEYAGQTTGAAITFSDSGQVSIDNSTIQYTSGLGIKFADGAYPASFTGNTITGGTSYPVEIYGNYARYLPAGNGYTGNTADAIKVMGDQIQSTGTWYDSGVPFEIQGTITVENGGSPPTLTIGPGCTLKFKSGTGLIVGDSYYGYYGNLIADGSGGTITFTSAQTTPAPGDWLGVQLIRLQSSTAISNAVIEYGGSGSYNAGLVVGNNTGTIANNTIRHSSGVGAKFLDGGGGAGTFTGNYINNNAYPVYVYGDYMCSIPSGNDFSGNTTDVIKVESDTVSTEGTWLANGAAIETQGAMYFNATTTIESGITMTVLGDMYVYRSSGVTTLTIGEGGTLKFAPGFGMVIGDSYYGYWGALVADGTSGSMITFTSNQTIPAPGDWDGITMSNVTHTSSMLDYVAIEYAGSTTGANLTVGVNTVSITNSTITQGSGIGVKFPDGGGGDNSFTGNTVSYCSYPIDIYGHYMSSIPAGNTLTGNTTDVIKAQGDDVTAAGTWANNGVPIEVQSYLKINADTVFADDLDLVFKGSVRVYKSSGTATLTVGAGDTLKFDTGLSLTVGDSYYGYYGTLVADGTGGAITFTSNATTPQPGDWQGIIFDNPTSAGTMLDNVVVEYAGNTTGAGVSYSSPANKPSIDNSSIRYNSGMGVKFESGDYPSSFANNSIEYNTGYPVEIYPEYARYLPTGNTYSNNATDSIKVMGGIISTSGTWNYPGVPYEIQGMVYVYHSSTPPTLTIAPNNTLKFKSGAGLRIGDSYYAYYGKLVADGTGGAITFTSAADTPAPGDWDGINFVDAVSAGSYITYSTISYGGANNKGNIYLYYSETSVSITYNTITDSSSYGVYVSTGSTFDPSDEATNSWSDNASGNVYRP